MVTVSSIIFSDQNLEESALCIQTEEAFPSDVPAQIIDGIVGNKLIMPLTYFN